MVTFQDILTPGSRVSIPRYRVSRQLVVKFASGCDMDCDDCYMYKFFDQAWRQQPRFMEEAVMDQLALRLAQYMREHELLRTTVVLHGGEPGLAGIERIEYLARKTREAVPGRIVNVRIQTNGRGLLKLTDQNIRMVEALRRLDVRLSVSLDGTKQDNEYRVRHNGESTHAEVVKALKYLKKDRYNGMLRRILAVIRLTRKDGSPTDPVATYRYLRQFGVPLEFLRRLSHWDDTPEFDPNDPNDIPYARWLEAVWNAWVDDGCDVDIRIFNQLLNLTVAKQTGKRLPWHMLTEMFGEFTVGGIGIGPDGAITGFDGSRVTAEDAWKTRLNIFDHTLTQGLVELLVTAQTRGVVDLPDDCVKCPVNFQCGGDLATHRYRTVNGESSYNNRSVYCNNLLAFILGIENATAPGVAATS